MSSAHLEPGMVFGRDFKVVRALRAGGMGAVYVVDQLSTGKQRALKVMAPELASDAATRDRFVLEAKAAANIESDHVVEIVIAGVDDETGAPYLVMELLRGEELADVAERTGPMTLGDVAEILAQVGHALEQAHANGIVHRDLKPENIFLAASKRRDAPFTAKVLDFGIAKLVADSQKTGTQPLGTPLFMSPEQTDRRGKISPATDVWALGLITFKLITGQDFWREAHGDGSLAMLLREIVVDEVPLASVREKELGLEGKLPHGFDAWFAKCVNRNIDARFQNAGDAVRAFAEIVPASAGRGTLVIQGGAGGDSGRLPTGQAPMSSVKVRPTGASVEEAEGATVAIDAAMSGALPRAVTAQASTNTAAAVSHSQAIAPAEAKAKGSKAWILLAAVMVGGIGAYLTLGRDRGGLITPMPTATSTASVAAPVPSASASAIAASTTPGGCPSGMVLIQGGETVLGARDLADYAQAKPTHEAKVTSFCLDKTEVTTKAYDACVESGMCERALDHVSWPNIKDAAKKKFSPLCNESHADRAEHPINCVAWTMADRYCKKHDARLPTEAEWEYAARGARQRRYPWGDEAPDAKRLNACGKECAKWSKDNGGEALATMYDDDDGYPATAPVGSFPAGASSHGVLDLAGNVWEWTADWFAPYSAEAATDPKGPATGTERVARGGDFLGSNADWARPAWRFKTDPDTYNHAIGFRCAANTK